MTLDQVVTLTLFARRVASGDASEAEIGFMLWYAELRIPIDLIDPFYSELSMRVKEK